MGNEDSQVFDAHTVKVVPMCALHDCKLSVDGEVWWQIDNRTSEAEVGVLDLSEFYCPKLEEEIEEHENSSAHMREDHLDTCPVDDRQEQDGDAWYFAVTLTFADHQELWSRARSIR